jgi:mannose/fructose/N-acetylgalactosamine-specific phosphotransferase system component IIC
MTMHRWTILFGLLLVAIGLGGYYFADAKQPMALIPAILGIAMFVCGVVAAQGAMRRLAIHVAALIGMIGFVGPMVTIFNDITNTANTAEVLAKGLTSALCLMFVLMCVNSFLEARRARTAGMNTDEKEELNTDIQDEQDLIS